MRNPHRVYEIDPYGTKWFGRGSRPFIEDFGCLIDQCLAFPVGTEDPRALVRMGPEPYRPRAGIDNDPSALRVRAYDMISPNVDKWAWLYEHLQDNDSRRLLLLVLAYRLIGWKFVKLPLNNAEFWAALAENKSLGTDVDLPEPVKLAGLRRFDLNQFGKDLNVFSDEFGIFNEFIYPQYFYRGFDRVICPDLGDYVLDCGACYGGTTLNFANAVGPSGRVYSFEFLPENTSVYQANIHNNLHLLNRVCLVEAPVYAQSDVLMSIVGSGPATQITLNDIEGTKKVRSIRIDDFVNQNGFPKVNFIKMDIEGAEMEALKGAMSTIERFKPKMAISVYHKLTDFYDVPRLLNGIRGDYRFFLGHSTVHGDETVIFAT